MKLKNKQTGEIGELVGGTGLAFIIRVYAARSGDTPFVDYQYNSLAELCEEWTDYEESKELYFVDVRQDDCIGILNTEENPKWCARLVELGLGFETEKDADKAVEKLKAITRLQNKGFRFEGCEIEMNETAVPEITITAFIDTEEPETLNLVNFFFGGEE